MLNDFKNNKLQKRREMETFLREYFGFVDINKTNSADVSISICRCCYLFDTFIINEANDI